MKRFRSYAFVENTLMPMLIPEKELEFRSVSVIIFTKLVRLKTFDKGKSQRILIAFYYLFIHNLLLSTNERQCKKSVKRFECGHTHAESKFQVKI